MDSSIQKFGELRRSIVDALETRLAEIERAMASVRRNPGDAALVADAIRRLEELFGLGGPLGLNQVCRLTSLFRAELPPGPGPAIDALSFEDLLRPFLAAGASGASRPGSPGKFRRVFLTSADPAVSARVSEALRPFGYQVVAFYSPHALSEALHVERPLALMLGASGLPLPEELRSHGLPLFYVSGDGGLEERIAAIRAGAQGFFSAGDDAAALAAGLNRLELEPLAEAHRVMIVDDDPVAAGLHAALLRRAGMTVSTVTDPPRALDDLLLFHPDLLLLDMDLGPFSGDELAAAVRQHPAFVGLPILFLSSEARPTFQLAARGAGAEGFLVKPVPAGRLLAESLLRAEHGRALRTHLFLDGATGALNSPAFLSRLRGEVDLARRAGRSFCCARARIDGFASLDEPRRQAARRELYRLVRGRMRRTDVIGRSGTDGITIALLDSDASAGGRVLEEIRRAFADSQGATLSAGVAGVPGAEGGAFPLDAAWTALRRAADEGGNRVVVLPPDSVV
jgi:DNA-binding response OmpR family regulator